MMLLDTCFLIDLHREFAAARPGPAQDFLREHSDTAFAISVISATEFLEGFADPQQGEALLRSVDWLDVTPAISVQAASIRRTLRLQGQLIGDFDILIAATSLSTQRPLVTRNTKHFLRIPELKIVGYPSGDS